MQTLVAVVMVLFVLASGASPVWGQRAGTGVDGRPGTTVPHLTTCPAASSRDKLIANDGEDTECIEGRHLLLEADSYPRPPGELVKGPTLVPKDGGYAVRFALDRYDDVIVRIATGDGQVVRNVACGVLGPNTPEPFQKSSLQQEVACGEIPEGGRVEVGVGLAPALEDFVGYDPAQFSPYLSGVTVDRRGRVYVTLHTTHRYDPCILRFDRDGNYLDMVYPSNPKNLYAQGKRWEDVYEHVEYMDGHGMPLKPSSWRMWIRFWDDYYKMPFRIGPDGKGYFCVGMYNKQQGALAGDGIDPGQDLRRLDVVENLDRFWYWPSRTHECPYCIWNISRFDAGFDFDGAGNVLVASKSYSTTYHSQRIWYSPWGGTIRKIDLDTRRIVPAFHYVDGDQHEEPGPFLREPWVYRVEKGKQTYFDRMQKRLFRDGEDVTPDPRYDSPDRFCDIEDLAMDGQGNVLVIDGYPRRLKCYAGDGRWLGRVSGLRHAGRNRPFHDLVEIEHANDAYYILTSFRDDRDGPVHLLKCTGDPTDLEVVWSVPLHPLSRFIAVDTAAETPLVWVGNGNGRATLTRVSDQGTKADEVKHFGGIHPDALVDPAAFAVDPSGNLYVHDKAREAIVRVDPTGRITGRADLIKNQMAAWYARRRWFPVQGGGSTAYADGTRYLWHSPLSIIVDERHDRLWVNFRREHYGNVRGDFGKPGPLKPIYKKVVRYNLDLEKQAGYGDSFYSTQDGKFGVGDGLVSQLHQVCAFGDVDENGNVFFVDHNTIRPVRCGSGSVGVLHPDGTVAEEKLCRLNFGGGSIARDSKGNFYAYDGPEMPFRGMALGYCFPAKSMKFWGPRSRLGVEAFRRGGRLVLDKSEVSYLVKFGPDGGERNGPDEQWALRGGFVGQMCRGCDHPDNLLACDGADRIMAADVDHYSGRVVDAAGNVITRIGRYGNAETVPGPDGDASEMGFRNIYCVDAAGEHVYVGDRDLRRIAKVQMAYRQTVATQIPGDTR